MATMSPFHKTLAEEAPEEPDAAPKQRRLVWTALLLLAGAAALLVAATIATIAPLFQHPPAPQPESVDVRFDGPDVVIDVGASYARPSSYHALRVTGGRCDVRVGDAKVGTVRLELDEPLEVVGRETAATTASATLAVAEIDFDFILARGEDYVAGVNFEGTAITSCEIETSGELWRVVSFRRTLSFDREQPVAYEAEGLLDALFGGDLFSRERGVKRKIKAFADRFGSLGDDAAEGFRGAYRPPAFEVPADFPVANATITVPELSFLLARRQERLAIEQQLTFDDGAAAVAVPVGAHFVAGVGAATISLARGQETRLKVEYFFRCATGAAAGQGKCDAAAAAPLAASLVEAGASTAGWDVFANTVPERQPATFLSSLVGARHSLGVGRGKGPTVAQGRRDLLDVPKRLIRSCGHRGDWGNFTDYCAHAIWDDEYQSNLCVDMGDSQHFCGLIDTTKVEDGSPVWMFDEHSSRVEISLLFAATSRSRRGYSVETRGSSSESPRGVGSRAPPS